MQISPQPGLRLAALAMLVVFAAACSRTPDLGTRAAPDLDNADYPALIPLDNVLGPPVDPQSEAEKLAEDLNRRRDALKARAGRLNQPVVDPESAARLSDTPGT